MHNHFDFENLQAQQHGVPAKTSQDGNPAEVTTLIFHKNEHGQAQSVPLSLSLYKPTSK